MFSIFSSILFFGFISFLFYYYFNSKRKYSLPPGPPFGGIFSMGKGPMYVTFQELAETYGGMISIKFGLSNALILDDPKLIREAFNSSIFSGRIDHKFFTLLSGGKHGISTADGPAWSEQRRFVLRALRDFGFGKKSMEGFIMEEVQEFLKWMKEVEGVPTEMDRRFVLATVNSLWTLIAGERHVQGDPIIDQIIQRANEIFTGGEKMGGILQIFPELIDILPKMFLGQWHALLDRVEPLVAIFRDAVDEHLRNPADENSPRDLIDVYLSEVHKTKDQNSSFYGDRGYKSLIAVIGDLYGAGQGTTSNTLTWTVLYLVRFPVVQVKLQEELDQVIGRNRLPSLSDRPNLPYAEALTMEIFRHSSITPLGIFHRATEDTTLNGFDIRENTILLPNVYSVHYNREIWGDPENFRPERFLSPDGRKVEKSENLMPFGMGKRQCLGETLARDNYFLFLTSIYQRFQILPDPANPNPSLEASKGFFREAQKFTVIIKERINSD